MSWLDVSYRPAPDRRITADRETDGTVTLAVGPFALLLTPDQATEIRASLAACQDSRSPAAVSAHSAIATESTAAAAASE